MNNLVKNVILTPLNILYQYSPKNAIQIMFYLKTGQRLNLKNPSLFNEKLQWIKLYDKNELMPICVDKYEVRQYIKDCGCEEILNHLLWEGFQAEEIPFEKLPERFVIKVTHGQGFNIICKDKKDLNIPKTIKKLKRWLHAKYLPCYGEWFYGKVKPRIIIEDFLGSGQEDTPNDYKVFCFHGNPKIIDVHVDRFTHHRRNIYNLEWNRIENVILKYPNDRNLSVEKPKVLEQLLTYARKLSEQFMHVRVDFYIIDSKIYFGELTFTNGAGFDSISPKEFDEIMGSWIDLRKGEEV